jgi:hypothetical protein
MKAAEVSFQTHLRREVDQTAKRFERAREKVFALTGGEEIEAGPALLEATEALSEEMHSYINALRRLAHYAAHQARVKSPAHLTTHA